MCQLRFPTSPQSRDQTRTIPLVCFLLTSQTRKMISSTMTLFRYTRKLETEIADSERPTDPALVRVSSISGKPTTDPRSPVLEGPYRRRGLNLANQMSPCSRYRADRP